jgi:hypothetical protein
MKLEYGTITLGDDNEGDLILDDGGTHSRLVDQTPLAGGAAPAVFARANHSNSRTFTVAKQHATPADAVAWFNSHPDELPDVETLRIAEGENANEMTGAVLVSVERMELIGVSTKLRYTFTGGKIIAAL